MAYIYDGYETVSTHVSVKPPLIITFWSLFAHFYGLFYKFAIIALIIRNIYYSEKYPFLYCIATIKYFDL
jgi:hypothetical protein